MSTQIEATLASSAAHLDHRSGSGANGDSHLVADDVGEGRLPQPWRTV